MRILLITALVSSLFLSACATVPTSAPSATTAHNLSAETLSHWQLSAALGIKTAQEGANASLRWQQKGDEYHMQILDPLGLSRATLTGTPEQVVLSREGMVYRAARPEALLQTQLGWELPVSNLVYWVRGLPAPYTAAQALRDPAGHLIQLDQQGWRIAYADYVHVEQFYLPRKMIMTRGSLTVRLVVQQWQL